MRLALLAALATMLPAAAVGAARCPDEAAALRALARGLRGGGAARVWEAYDRAALSRLCARPDEPASERGAWVRTLPGWREPVVPVAAGVSEAAPEPAPLALVPAGPDALFFVRRGGGGLPPGGSVGVFFRSAGGWRAGERRDVAPGRVPSVRVLDPTGIVALLERAPDDAEAEARLTLLAVGAEGAAVIRREDALAGVEPIEREGIWLRFGRRQPGAPADAPRLWYEERARRRNGAVTLTTRPVTPWLDAWQAFLERREPAPVAFAALLRLREELPRRAFVERVDEEPDGVRLRVRSLEELRPVCGVDSGRAARHLSARLGPGPAGWVVRAIAGVPADCVLGATVLTPGWAGPLPEGGPAVLAGGQSGPADVAADATHVYWLDASPGRRRLLRVPVEGGAIEVLGESGVVGRPELAPGAAKIALAAGRAHWVTDAGGAVWAGRAGGEPAATVHAGTGFPAGLASDGTALFWTDRGRDALFAAAAGAPRALATGLGMPLDVATDGKALFVTAGGGRLLRVERTGAARLLFEPLRDDGEPAEEPGAVAVAGGRVVWTRPVAGLVLSVPVRGGLATVLASGLARPCDVAADGDDVRWAACGDGTLGRVGKGATPAPAWPDGVRALALGARHVFFVSRSQVVRLPR